MPEIERLHAIGALGPNVLLIHCGWLSPKELILLGEFDVKVVACASSSLHNAYGNIAMGSIPELLEIKGSTRDLRLPRLGQLMGIAPSMVLFGSLETEFPALWGLHSFCSVILYGAPPLVKRPKVILLSPKRLVIFPDLIYRLYGSYWWEQSQPFEEATS